MEHPTIQASKHPTTIDIILSVIDNFGDIGFACELIVAWRREVGNHSNFIIWTNHVPEVISFVDKNRHILGAVEIMSIEDFGRERLSSVLLVLFHADIPDTCYFDKHSLVLRIDYLSFDKTWTVHHLDEHISSTQNCQIIEMIPSPFPESGGLLYPYDTGISRQDLANMYDLDPTKNWILFFAYPTTLQHRIIFDSISNNSQVLLSGCDQAMEHANIVNMPWVDIATWHALIDESVWTLMRGEVSAVASLMRGKLAFWDTYKMIGGFYAQQSEEYLTLISANEEYRDIHNRLNGVKEGAVLLSELERYIDKYDIPIIKNGERINNLISEIKKCIDSHEFSI